MAVVSTRLLQQDASNRALRTFVVNLAIDVGLAVVLALYTGIQDTNTWSDVEWSLLGFSLSKTAVASAGAYILRRFLDPSALPTPLPPAPAVEPAEDERYA